MPQRIDFYGNYHKALRRALFEFSARTGLLDYEHDSDGVTRLVQEFERLARALFDHGWHEDRYMHPLLERYAPQVLEKMDRQHTELDPGLDALQKQLREVASADDRAAAGAAFYAALNRYIGSYLEHLADEEEIANPILWERCPPEELSAAVNRFRQSFAMDQVATSFEFMLPALSLPERADLYKSVRDNAPRPIFDTLIGVAKKILAAGEFDDLRQRLG